MSGREGALCRCRCHEAHRRPGRCELVPEADWLHSLDDREFGDYIRGLNAVDRAVDGYRKLLDEGAAA